ENDIDSLDNIGIYGDRVIANQVISILDSVLINQLKPQNISCLVKVNDDNNAVLLLLKVDKIDLLSKEAKKEFVSILESILYETNNLSTRMQFIGVCNKNNTLEITQSPYRDIQTSYLLAYSSDLLDFYGTLNEE
ncbi:MAG: hypothetical protein KC414_14670, partial [Romboutsia sp.]|nr:hypothetical protein [Romboutsia sp.]